MVEPLVYVEAENIDYVWHKVCDIVSCSSLAASLNDGMHGHTVIPLDVIRMDFSIPVDFKSI